MNCLCSKAIVLLLGVLASFTPCYARLPELHFPLRGALDATLIVMVRQQSEGVFRVDEVFMGQAARGELISLPGFQLVEGEPYAGSLGGNVDCDYPCESATTQGERIEPIRKSTRILVFLKPTKTGTQRWEIADSGSSYFWNQDPHKRKSLRAMAESAVAFRRSWNSARNLPDPQQRTEALWPYMWDSFGMCYGQTKGALQEIGTVAGDYIAGQWGKLTSGQKWDLLRDSGGYHSQRLHAAVSHDLEEAKTAWEDLLDRRGKSATYDEVSPPGRFRYSPRRPQDAEADQADDISGSLDYGFAGLDGFHDRSDLPLIRDSALWALKYRFDQVCEEALRAFYAMPDKANLPIIEAIWSEFSKRPWAKDQLLYRDVMVALLTHRFLETIPLMAQFVNAGFAEDEAQQFLVEMTGVNFGNDVGAWRNWYKSQ